ncbi:MAG: hypothetical protein U5O39_18570 [Gammaproteobacteria bacterium]|nr:hypothetical protein [Gammaproteobacteria bacterium]
MVKARTEKKAKDVMQFALIPIVGVIAGFIVSALVAIFYLGISINSEHRNALANKNADSIAFQINQREERLLTQMEGAGRSIQLTGVVSNEAVSARNLEATRLRELIPHALRVKLIPLGTAEIDRSANPPFSFPSKDLVNRVERGEDAHAEAINAGGTWVLSVAAPIRTPSDDSVRGTLFVYLEMAALSDGLDEIVDGKLSLLQRFGNMDPNAILELGRRLPMDDNTLASCPIRTGRSATGRQSPSPGRTSAIWSN